MLRETWMEMDRLLRAVDFGALWPGFAPVPLALYDGETACRDGKQKYIGNASAGA